jgi:hypothetical protein
LIEGNFERENLKKFRFEMDRAGQWVQRVLEIILAYPTPRLDKGRSLRRFMATDLESQDEEEDGNDVEDGGCREDVVGKSHSQFYDGIMQECAQREADMHTTKSSNVLTSAAGRLVYSLSSQLAILWVTLRSVGTLGRRLSKAIGLTAESRLRL